MALAYLVSPFFSLGIFLHILQDSFTTAKDRGCEWFYPLSRLVKRGIYDANWTKQHLHRNERVYFYQEDPKGIIEQADPDLREPGPNPTPWRRVYGPALNSRLLDRGFLWGSVALILVWLLAPDGSHLALLSNNPITFYVPYFVGYASLSIIYIAGDIDRRDRDKPTRIPELSFLKIPLFIVGIGLLATWFVLYRSEIWANLETIFSNWISILLGVVLVTLASLVVIKWQMRRGKAPAIV